MKSFIPWVGGKTLLAKTILSCFPTKYDRYIEVFGGSGAVLFAQNKYAPLEVYNDKNGDLVNLFRCVKFHCNELQNELQHLLNARETFTDYRAQLLIPGLTDIQRAARFYYLVKASFGSDTRSYGCTNYNSETMLDYLGEIHKRLNGKKNVVIENRDFAELIKVYDRPSALFYCDPPYYQAEKHYQVPFSPEEHQKLKNCLEKIQGKFVLSYNNCEFIWDLYQKFYISPVTRQNSLSSGEYKELIITNYKPESKGGTA